MGHSLFPGASNYAPASGIAVFSENNTIENFVIRGYGDSGIRVTGSHNTILNCSLSSGLKLLGDYNNITGNSLLDYGISLGGNHNIIEKNFMTGHGLYMAGSILDTGPPPEFNVIVGNTVRDCHYAVFAIYLSNATNVFYLNNFINNTNGNISPFRWQLTKNGVVAEEWSEGASWIGIYPNNAFFDNRSMGNYWSDYKGTDSNGDGIGDKPYFIGGELQDNFPLMNPVETSNLTLSVYEWTENAPYESPSQPASISPLPSPSSTVSPSTSPSPTPQPKFPTLPPLNDSTPTPSPSLTPSPTQEPTSTPNTQPENFTPTIIIVALVATVVLVAALAYSAKHNRRKSLNPKTNK